MEILAFSSFHPLNSEHCGNTLFCFWLLVSCLLWKIWFTLVFWQIVKIWVFAVTTLFLWSWLSDYFPSSGCYSPLAKPFPLFLSPGWFSWQHRWPCPGVLWVLQHLLQWRQRPHGGAAQKTCVPRAWHGECTLTQTLTQYNKRTEQKTFRVILLLTCYFKCNVICFIFSLFSTVTLQTEKNLQDNNKEW